MSLPSQSSEMVASMDEALLHRVGHDLFQRLQKMVRWEDPIDSHRTDGPIKDAYHQVCRELEERRAISWPGLYASKDAGCTCEWWGGGSIIRFDPGCPILEQHRR